MRPVLSEEVEIRQLAQPLVIVHEFRIRRAVPECQKLGKYTPQSVNIALVARDTSLSRSTNGNGSVFYW